MSDIRSSEDVEGGESARRSSAADESALSEPEPDERDGSEPGSQEGSHERPAPEPGTTREFVAEMLRLAWPLILSSSFWTIQVTIDRMLLTWYDPNAVSAAFMVTMLFWMPFVLLQSTANYSTTFVAQYLGANRPERIGPVVWQALYFSIITGLAFLLYLPFTGPILDWVGHEPAVQALEVDYLWVMGFVAMPGLIVASVSGFFGGRGDSITVMWLNGVGLLVNAVLDYLWIFNREDYLNHGMLGRWVATLPDWVVLEAGITGAGWATVIGMSTSALVGLALFWRRRFRAEFHTLTGWRFDPSLFLRLMRYGLPAGLQWFLEMTALTAFVMMLGWFGKAEFSASSIAFSINMMAFLPMIGMGQAVAILVGQRLGQNRPDLAARSTWTGFGLCWCYMVTVAVLYVTWPTLFTMPFRSDVGASEWATIETIVQRLLIFIAIYSVFDALNIIFSFALRGAGDTFFVSMVSLGLSWPMMVIPSYLTYRAGWSLDWPWIFASTYIITIGAILMMRFLYGKWKSMRVIESVPVE